MGSLSNAEGQKLENLIAKLDITQPEEVVRKQLSEIRSQYSVFVTNGAIVLHTQRLKSDPGGNLLS